MKRIALVMTWSITTAVAFQAQGQAPVDDSTLSDPGIIAAGKAQFSQACTYCHGREGSGGKVPSFKGRHDLEAGYIFDTIANGRREGANIMPGWKESLSNAEITALVAYIVWLTRQAPDPS